MKQYPRERVPRVMIWTCSLRGKRGDGVSGRSSPERRAAHTHTLPASAKMALMSASVVAKARLPERAEVGDESVR